MKTKIALGFAALALTLVAINSINTVLAYQGDPKVKGPNYSQERHDTNIKSFQKNDYKSWLANMQGRGITKYINESNFKEFASAQLASQKGDDTKINAFRLKYGMGQGKGNGCGGDHNSNNGTHEGCTRHNNLIK